MEVEPVLKLFMVIILILPDVAFGESVQDFLIKSYLDDGFNNLEGHNYGLADYRCMAANIYREGIGEGLLGWIGIGQSVRNRMLSDAYPDNPCSVIWELWQYEWTEKFKTNSLKITFENHNQFIEVLMVIDNIFRGNFDGYIKGSMHYYNPDIVTPCYKDGYSNSLKIVNHVYVFNPNGKSPCLKKKFKESRYEKSKRLTDSK